MKKALVLLSGLLLAACGDKAITSEDLVSTMKASGVEINDVKDLKNDKFMVQGFKERFAFSIPEVAPKGGQAFICEKKEQCTPVFAYFDALKNIAGPLSISIAEWQGCITTECQFNRRNCEEIRTSNF